MPLEIFHMEQRSDEWFEVRRGIPTASRFDIIAADWIAETEELARWERNRAIVEAVNAGVARKDVAELHGVSTSTVGTLVNKGVPDEFTRTRAKQSASYMRELAGERITEQVAEGYSGGALGRGRTMEDEAREFYELVSAVEVEQIGFARNHGAGASPDGLVDAAGMLEIKTAKPSVLIEHLLSDDVPSEHVPQVQGQMWVMEREWCDLLVYWPGMPHCQHRVHRDDTYIGQTLAPAVLAFCDELEAMVDEVTGGAA